MVDGPNVYTYVVQNPWTKFDPLGLAVKHSYDDDGNLVGHDVNGHYYSRHETDDGVVYRHSDGSEFESAKGVLEDSARRTEDERWNGVPEEYRDIVSRSTGFARFRPDELNHVTGKMDGVRDRFTGSPFQMNNLSPYLYQSMALSFTLESGVSPLIVAPAPAMSYDLTVHLGFFGKDGPGIVATSGQNLLFPGENGEQHLGVYGGFGFDGFTISNARNKEQFKSINNIRGFNADVLLDLPPNLSLEWGFSDDRSIRSFTGTVLIPNGPGLGVNYNAFESEVIE